MKDTMEKYTDETFYRAVEGDESALEMVVEQFTPLVHKFARKYQFMTKEYMYDDLVQVGQIGIWTAVKTFDLDYRVNGKRIRPMTWVFPKVRAAVQSAARKDKNLPKYPLSLEQSDWGNNLEDDNVFEVKDDLKMPTGEYLVRLGCGGVTEGKRAEVVKRRFGLMGQKPMRPIDIAQELGMSKQTLNGYLNRYYATVKSKEPKLRELIP
jgi:RNA polymerase sigma factor (sigma-70 family)